MGEWETGRVGEFEIWKRFEERMGIARNLTFSTHDSALRTRHCSYTGQRWSTNWTHRRSYPSVPDH